MSQALCLTSLAPGEPWREPGAPATSAGGRAGPEPGVQKHVITKNDMALKKMANSSPNGYSIYPGKKIGLYTFSAVVDTGTELGAHPALKGATIVELRHIRTGAGH